MERPRRNAYVSRAEDLGETLNRDPLDDVAGNLFVAAVVESRGARVGVAGQALDVFEGGALLEKVGDGGDAEGMG